jgi:hypothetical protein
MTQRYCHPQADSIQRAFEAKAGRQKLVTEGGHREKAANKSKEVDTANTYESVI